MSKDEKEKGKTIDLEITFKDLEGRIIGEEVNCAVVEEGKMEPMKNAKTGAQLYVTIYDKDLTLTMRKAICQSLMGRGRDHAPDEEKDYKKFELMMSIKDADKTIDLDTKDRSLILECVNKFQGGMVYGQIRQHFE